MIINITLSIRNNIGLYDMFTNKKSKFYKNFKYKFLANWGFLISIYFQHLA